jgi:hypothetical protein
MHAHQKCVISTLEGLLVMTRPHASPLASPACPFSTGAAPRPDPASRRTVAVYLGLYRSQALLDIMTRSGRMEEMSQGPIWYGLVLIAATLACWRERPAGVAAVAVMCAGDGFAELVGQALGGPRWPHNRRKTVAGSCALAAFGFATVFGYVCGDGFRAPCTRCCGGLLVSRCCPEHPSVQCASQRRLVAS